MKRFLTIPFVLFILGQNNVLFAQDEAATETATAEATETTAVAEETDESTAEAESNDDGSNLGGSNEGGGNAGDAKAEWDKVFGQWTTILTRMRAIQTEYQIAEPDALEGLEKEWKEKIEQGQQLMPAVRAAAIAAQKANPNSDRQLTKFLVKMLADEVESDNYEVAYELGNDLVGSQLDEKKLNNLAGIAAYGMSQFAEAEELLTKAEAEGALAGPAAGFLSNLRENADLADLWEAEQALRAAEAAADEADKLPRVKMETTSGDFVIELFENEAPETVGNFINLVEKGYYDDLSFHRVMKGFMAQGGCPDGNGQGGPGYKIYCECILPSHRKHWRGSISMAKTSARNTGGSQFFFNFVPTPHLNGDHTVFGRIVEGLDNLADIIKRDPNDPNAPATKIIKAEVLNKRDHEYVPNKVQ